MRKSLLTFIFVLISFNVFSDEADEISIGTPHHLAEAYAKCLEEVSWGYSIPEKQKEKKVKISSMNPRVNFNSNKKWQTVDGFKTEPDCVEALTLAKEKKEIDATSFGCRKRFSGKDVVVSVYEAKAMVKLSTYTSLSTEEITFSSLEKCTENILKKKKYKFQIRQYEFQEVEIGPYKSSDTMRFISSCQEVKKVVCKNDDNVGFTKVEYFD